MPRVGTPRLRALSNIAGGGAVGFGGGLATGLAQTIPYGLEYFPSRRREVMNELSRLTIENMREAGRIMEQQMEIMGRLEQEELKQIGDILQRNIFVRPTTKDKANPFLSSLLKMNVELVPQDEVIQSVRARKFAPDVYGVPTSVVQNATALHSGYMKVSINTLDRLLSLLKLRKDTKAQIINAFSKLVGNSFITPVFYFDYVLQMGDQISELEEIDKILQILLRYVIPGDVGIIIQQQQQQAQKPGVQIIE
jgi:hypothetical protein